MDLVELMSHHMLVDQDPNDPVEVDPIEEHERARARAVIEEVIQEGRRKQWIHSRV